MNTHNINYRTKSKLNNCFTIIYLTFLLTFSKHSVYSQETKLSKSITYDFKKSETKKIDSIVTTYKVVQKKSWLNLLPSLNYDLKNNSFNVGISLNSFASYYQQQQRNKIELAKLEHSLYSKLDNDLATLKLKIEEFYYKYEILKSKIEIFKIDYDLFKITSGKYKNSEIPTEDFLKLKKAYLSKKNNLKLEFFKLKFSANKITKKSKNVSLRDTLSILHNAIKKYK